MKIKKCKFVKQHKNLKLIEVQCTILSMADVQLNARKKEEKSL